MTHPHWLWLDDSDRSLAAKVAHAAEVYAAKFGRAAEVCFVHPSALNGQDLRAGDVKVLPSQMVQPDYFWLG